MNGQVEAMEESETKLPSSPVDKQLENVKEHDVRPTGSPVRRVKADPELVSDVIVTCSTPTSSQSTSTAEQRCYEDMMVWDSLVQDLPSDDEEGESFDKTVATLLIGMNMVQYISVFKDADVGLNLFLTLTEEDLEVLGISDKAHQRDIAYGVANIRKKRGGQNVVRGLNAEVADSTLTIQEAMTIMCHTVKHINNLVVLLRNYRTRLNSNSVRNEVLDVHHSAALGAKILTKEALAQAELLKVQLHGMLHKLDPLRSEKSLARKSKLSASKKSSKGHQKLFFGAVLMPAVITSVSLFLLFFVRRPH